MEITQGCQPWMHTRNATAQSPLPNVPLQRSAMSALIGFGSQPVNKGKQVPGVGGHKGEHWLHLPFWLW